MTAQIQSTQIAQTHRYSHLPIPTEAEMEEIINIIWQHKDNPQMLAKLEEVTPPHIMKALQDYSRKKTNESKILLQEAKKKADEAEARAEKAEAWAREVKELEESIISRLTPQQRKELGLID